MDRSSSSSSAVAAATPPARDASRIRPTRSLAPGSGARAGNGRPAVSAESTQRVTEDHDQIAQDQNVAQDQNDVVVNRLFAAGLELQAALRLIGDGRVAGHVGDAIGSLDQALRDHRDIFFHRGAYGS